MRRFLEVLFPLVFALLAGHPQLGALFGRTGAEFDPDGSFPQPRLIGLHEVGAEFDPDGVEVPRLSASMHEVGAEFDPDG